MIRRCLKIAAVIGPLQVWHGAPTLHCSRQGRNRAGGTGLPLLTRLCRTRRSGHSRPVTTSGRRPVASPTPSARSMYAPIALPPGGRKFGSRGVRVPGAPYPVRRFLCHFPCPEPTRDCGEARGLLFAGGGGALHIYRGSRSVAKFRRWGNHRAEGFLRTGHLLRFAEENAF